MNIQLVKRKDGKDFVIAEGLKKPAELAYGKELSGSEALFGFCGWLTSRREVTIMSSSNDAAVIADLIKEFCEINKLSEPREGWDNNLILPPGQK